MTVIFIAPIILASMKHGDHYKINTINFYGDSKFYKRFLTKEQQASLLFEVGLYDVTALEQSEMIVIAKSNLDIKRYAGNEWLIAYKQMEIINDIQHILNAAWFFKDHAATVDNIYAVLSDDEKRPKVAKFNKIGFYSKSSGRRESVCFDLGLFDLIKPVYQPFKTLCIHQRYLGRDASEITGENLDLKNTIQSKFAHNDLYSDRLKRSIAMKLKARAETLPSYKIAFYVASIECLFSVNRKDNKPVISQRISDYLSLSEAERIAFESGYDIRSKFLHGQLLENNDPLEELVRLSDFLDEVCRKTILKAIREDYRQFCLPDSSLVIYFNSLKNK